MDPVIIQIIGLAAMLANLLSFQAKAPRAILLWQLCMSVLFGVHYYLLGAYTACLLNVVATTRNALFSQAGRRRFAASPLWVPVFIAAALGVYALSFIVFDKEWSPRSALIELLPVAGLAVQTVAFRMRSAQRMRLANAVSVPFWASYNACYRSIGGLLSDAAMAVSILVGYLRYRKKEKAAETESPAPDEHNRKEENP